MFLILHFTTFLATTVHAHSQLSSDTASLQYTTYSNEPAQYDDKILTQRQATYEFHKWENLWGPNKWCFWWWCKDKTNNYSTSLLDDADTSDNNKKADKNSPDSASGNVNDKTNPVRRGIAQDPTGTPHHTIPLSITAPSTKVDPRISILAASSVSTAVPLTTPKPAHGGADHNITKLAASSSATISLAASTNGGIYLGPSVVTSAAARRSSNWLQKMVACGLVVLGTLPV